MTRSPVSFKESDLVRAIKCATKAGLQVAGFEVNPKTGNIVVHAGKPATTDVAEDGNPWDKALRQ